MCIELWLGLLRWFNIYSSCKFICILYPNVAKCSRLIGQVLIIWCDNSITAALRVTSQIIGLYKKGAHPNTLFLQQHIIRQNLLGRQST